MPCDKKLQLLEAELGVIPLLAKILSSGTSVAKQRAATSLAQLSENTQVLSRSRMSKWKCRPPSGDAVCKVHDGCCSVKKTFCLVKAGAIPPLIQILMKEGETEEVEVAVLSCIATLLQDEIWKKGSSWVAEMSGVQGIVRALDSKDVKGQEKALWMLERIFRKEALRAEYGGTAQVVLIDLVKRRKQ